jgi:hypothetical protein
VNRSPRRAIAETEKGEREKTKGERKQNRENVIKSTGYYGARTSM